MNMSFSDVIAMRKGVVEYGAQMGTAALKAKSIDDLLEFLRNTTARSVGKEDLKHISFYDLHELDVDSPLFKKHPAWQVYMDVHDEEKSLQRIGYLLGKPVLEMSDTDLQEAAKELFFWKHDDFARQAAQVGIQYEGPHPSFDYDKDAVILLGVLERKGLMTRVQLREKILHMDDLGAGYFDTMLRLQFENDTEPDGFMGQGKRYWGIHNSFQGHLHKEQLNLAKHLTFDDKLRSQHTVTPPKLLEDRTIDLGIKPYALAFTLDGNLAVLGGRLDATEDNWESAEMILGVYDIKDGSRIHSVNTHQVSRFDGAIGLGGSFQGSLTVGSDGVFYVNGGKIRFDRTLSRIEDGAGLYSPSLNLIIREEILRWEMEVFNVVESEGTFYFALQQKNFPKGINNTIVAVDKNGIVGQPLSGYSPTSSSNNSACRDTPEINVFGNELTFKVNHSIVGIDRSMNAEDMKAGIARKPFLWISCEDNQGMLGASNHCFAPNGMIYGVSEFPDEVAQSIKGYAPGAEKGEFATHVYPEHHPGGWASARAMAISKDSILAYSCADCNKVYLYWLP